MIVKSAINALGVHGMDKYFDRGIAGLKYYAALAVVGRNIHQMDTFQIKKELKSAKRKKQLGLRSFLLNGSNP